MTAQVSDKIFFKGLMFNITDFSSGEIFEPRLFGLNPAAASAACWRGYVCEYRLDKDRLLLDGLQVNHRYGKFSSSLCIPPAINGNGARRADNNVLGQWLYTDMQYPLAYTGGLIVARDFIHSLYVHMGFHPAWKYREVYELIFENGRLREYICLNQQFKAFREQIRLQNLEPMGKDKSMIEEWVHACFSRKYK